MELADEVGDRLRIQQNLLTLCEVCHPFVERGGAGEWSRVECVSGRGTGVTYG